MFKTVRRCINILFRDSFQNSEYNYLKKVILLLEKETWSVDDLKTIQREFRKFVKKNDLNELDLLRKGEVMLAEYCEVDLSDLNDVKDMMFKCFNAIDEISSPICLVIVSALNKLALSEIEGKCSLEEGENYNGSV